MAAGDFLKFNKFSQSLAKGLCGDLEAGGALRFALTNTAPTAATDVLFDAVTAHAAPAAANGYGTTGRNATISGSAEAGGVYTLATTTDVVITATAGGIGPFRYVILYCPTGTLPLVAYYDYGSSITLASGETFTVDVTASLFTITTT
jgi:hypothetical protein